jgi:serine/threonine protein kinase/Flp pilus assembly protein TadD
MSVPSALAEALRGRYALERELGHGGMATVYLARDLKHDRLVAFKQLRPDLAAVVGPERFLREIRLTAQLRHSHLLTVLDSGENAGFLWYTMPFIAGGTLRARLDEEGELPLEDALTITRNVSAALACAHRQGIMHRDVKPENILLEDDEALLADFGIARALADTGRGKEPLTGTGLALGTPTYMSPEQAAGEREVDARADIYALGCILYEMLAGEPPYTGPTAQAIIAKRFADPVPSIRRIRPEIPPFVDSAIQKALARSPADRFPTVSQFAQALVGGATTPGGVPATMTTAQDSPVKSIGVLPFADMSADRDQDYFCEGISEEIINALTRIKALRVASRSSAFAFKGKGQDIRLVGQQLGVATVLEGSVRKAGTRLRITAQLINVTDGYHLWSERFDRELEDVFAVQDEIAENIVRALRVVLSEEEKRAIEKPRPENVLAYEYYLRGRQFFHQHREKGHQFARRMFARAIEIDPGFVLAHAGMADCSSMLYMYWDASEANLEQANASSQKALDLGPEVAEPHAARGLALTIRKRYEEAHREFDTAIRLDPNLFEAYYFYARACFQQGKLEDAAHWFEQASAVRPEDFQSPALLALAYTGLGRGEEAVAARRRAVRIIERHLEFNPDDVRAWYMGALVLCPLGELERSREWVARARALEPEDSGVLYNIACVYALLGETDEALDFLEKAIQNGFGHREWIEFDSDLDSLRTHPRFQALMSRM